MSLVSESSFECRQFKNLKFPREDLKGKHFSECSFSICDFTENDFRDCRFVDCKFWSCNLSLVVVEGAKLQDVWFEESKLVGVDFSNCDKFILKFDFSQCVINDCNFSDLTLHETSFRECTITDSDFVEADLTGSDFSKSDLSGCLFHNTNLSNVNLVDARNFSINPLNNKLEKAKVSIPEAVNLAKNLGVIIK